jgi:TIR domain
MASLRIFVSHSSKDNELGVRLVNDLRQAIGREEAVWYDISGGLHGGDVWWDRIVEEITAREVFLLVLSPDALTSKWVRDELRIAWNQKNSPSGKLIIPVLYQACEVRADLRTLQIISFLPPKSYEQGFDELLTALGLLAEVQRRRARAEQLAEGERRRVAEEERLRRSEEERARSAEEERVRKVREGPRKAEVPSSRLKPGIVYGLVSGVLAALIGLGIDVFYAQTGNAQLLPVLGVIGVGVSSIVAGVLSARASGSVLSAVIAGGILVLFIFLTLVVIDIGIALDAILLYLVPFFFSILFGLIGQFLHKGLQVPQ